MLDAYPVFAGDASGKDIYFSPYKSQYGIQGLFFSTAYALLGLDSIDKLQLINSVLFALVVGVLSLLYSKVYSSRFALVFFVVMISSPWVVAFARNLYWVPVLWFLPAVFSALAYKSIGNAKRLAYCVLTGLAVFIKSLAGYEYLSAITLFACSIFIVAPFFSRQESDCRRNLKFFLLTFSFCVVGFIFALLLHAGMRGDTIVAGLQNIFEQDVKRRTYGDPSTFDDVFKASLQSSPFDVVQRYINVWETQLFFYLPGAAFKWLILISLAGLLYVSISSRKFCAKNSVVFLVFFAASASWLVLAKGHSYIHTQLNYVLWYFGFVQALAYITISCLILCVQDLWQSAKQRSFYKPALLVCHILVLLLMVVFGANYERGTLFEETFANLLADPGREIKTSVGIMVKVTQQGELAFYSHDCSQLDTSKTFYLHVYKNGASSSPNQYENLDFEWKRFELPSPLWPSKYAASCAALVKLPNYSVEKIDFGQYTVLGNSINIIWRDSMVLDKQANNKKIVAFNMTDLNWVNGVSGVRFFVKNNFSNRQSLFLDVGLNFSASGFRKVTALEYSDQFINVTVSGKTLSPSLDGYPNLIEVR
ncbi:hypothetical protein [Pseudomonas sp. IAC-BECa141]|nr:hypothetical protein [Pseudomonas sp. IAC-BECa141]UDI91416.1 hypothetical protein I5961_19995 [Pseudomonas sp. IAC-BECa141]